MPIATPSSARRLAVVTSSGGLGKDAIRNGARHTRELNLFLIVCWMLSVAGLTLPGRNAPLSIGALDPVALIKLGTRGVAFVVLGFLLLRHNSSLRSPILLRRLFPLIL